MPVGTLFEAAKMAGMKVGTVCTSRVTHATPAAFASHSIDRNLENFIAQYLVGNIGTISPVNDLIFGGGLCQFIPKLPGFPSCRADSEDLLSAAKARGYNIITSRAQLASATNET